jgi:DNA replication protein DnaC
MHTPASILGDLAAVTVRKQCGCGAEFPCEAAVARYVTRCPDCVAVEMDKQRKNNEAERAKKLVDRWFTICPLAFRATVREMLPMPHLLDKALEWKYGKKGLLLYGVTGGGKSRIAWLVLKRECMEGRRVAALTAISGVDYAASFEHGATHAAVWLRQYRQCDVLLCDDLWKGKMTESWESCLFGLLNERCDKEKPFICTLNDTGDTLKERLSPDRAEPMLRRLRESCTAISFMKGKKKNT